MMWCLSVCTIPADARFATVAAVPDSCRAALLLSGPENPWPSPVEATPAQDATSVEARKKEWVERYLSVCYPLRHIRVTSPYGYRSDPFTGKRRFHDGLDLHARGEAALAMMKGVVVSAMRSALPALRGAARASTCTLPADSTAGASIPRCCSTTLTPRGGSACKRWRRCKRFTPPPALY